MTLRCFSYGGGVQSTAALVLAAQRQIDYPIFLFANVGDDSEHPATLRYIQDVAMPYAVAHGIELAEVRPTRYGEPVTLLQMSTREDLRSVPIPLRDATGAVGIRSCTKHYKVIPIARETKRRGATAALPAVLGMGISIDEYHRMRSDSPITHQVYAYPLIDLRLSRSDCERIIRDADLPVPPKSSCWFCPFHRLAVWRLMKAQEPSIFMNAVVLEYEINAKRKRNGLPPNYLSGAGKPLDKAFGDWDQFDFGEIDEACESGHCMT